MKFKQNINVLVWLLPLSCVGVFFVSSAFSHGTVAFPKSRVYRVRFETETATILEKARALDANPNDSYFTWNQVSQFVPEAAGFDMSTAFDYSVHVPDGRIASGNHRFDNWVKNGGVIADGLDFTGLDIVSNQWPTTSVNAGESITIDYLASAPHSPSVFDVWITTPDWTPEQPLGWSQMQVIGEFWNRHSGGEPLGKYGDRQFAPFDPDGVVDQGISAHYFMDVVIPANLSGHHVIWVAWQRDDAAGEVFFSASDVMVQNSVLLGDVNLDGEVNLLDVTPFVDLLASGLFQTEADINQDGAVDLLDVAPFVELLQG